MTSIQRQFNLPNCVLSLEGFSDRTKSMSMDTRPLTLETRPLMTMLLSAECRFSGQGTPLQGGRDFLESLIRVIHLYTQAMLSGVKVQSSSMPEQIQITALGHNQHQLLFQPATESGVTSTIQEVRLSSVHLFDLVEAVDQLLADPQTLPDLTMPLAPIAKDVIQGKHPLAEQVVPASVGVTSLVVAAIALSTLPTPEVQRPSDKLPNASTPQPTQTSQPTPQAITDQIQLEELQNKLFTSLDKAWKEGVPSDSVIYQVTVDENSRVMGYAPQSDLAREEVSNTPLLNVLELSKAGGSLAPAATAQFEVTFNPNGTLDVRPWENSPTPDSAPDSISSPSSTPDATP